MRQPPPQEARGIEPDGEYGWSGCTPAELPTSNTPPFPKMTLRLVLAKDTYATGEDIEGELVINNDAQNLVEFEEGLNPLTDDGTLLEPSTGFSRFKPVSARLWSHSFFGNTHRIRLEPGDNLTLKDLVVRTQTCGDTELRPVPPGSYEVLAGFKWRAEGSHAEWYAPSVSVTISKAQATPS